MLLNQPYDGFWSNDSVYFWDVWGLKLEIKRLVEVMMPTTFLHAVEVAKIEERNSDKTSEGHKDLKRKWDGKNNNSRDSKNGSDASKKEENDLYPKCKKCDKRHPGKCKKGSMTCYKCGKPSHMFKDCMEGVTCYECGMKGHVRTYCPKLQNNTNGGMRLTDGNIERGGGQKEVPKARARAYIMTAEEDTQTAD